MVEKTSLEFAIPLQLMPHQMELVSKLTRCFAMCEKNSFASFELRSSPFFFFSQNYLFRVEVEPNRHLTTLARSREASQGAELRIFSDVGRVELWLETIFFSIPCDSWIENGIRHKNKRMTHSKVRLSHKIFIFFSFPFSFLSVTKRTE